MTINEQRILFAASALQGLLLNGLANPFSDSPLSVKNAEEVAKTAVIQADCLITALLRKSEPRNKAGWYCRSHGTLKDFEVELKRTCTYCGASVTDNGD